MVLSNKCQAVFRSPAILVVAEEFVGLAEIEDHSCTADQMPLTGVKDGSIVTEVLKETAGRINDRRLIEIQDALYVSLQKLM